MASGCPTIVVAGRHNVRRNSAALDALIGDLEVAGYQVCRLETRDAQTARWLEDRLETPAGSRFLRFLLQCNAFGAKSRRARKALLLLTRPARWDYFLTYLVRMKSPAANAAKDLRKLLRVLRAEQVCLIAHSSGGIAATLVASEPSVSRLICFGYPFRHPGRADEPERTAHLQAVTKPLLIIQGDQDAYGTAADAHRYGLSPSTTVARIDSGHDYDSFQPGEYRRCLAMLLAFLDG